MCRYIELFLIIFYDDIIDCIIMIFNFIKFSIYNCFNFIIYIFRYIIYEDEYWSFY